MSERNPYDLFLDALLEPLIDPEELERRFADWPEQQQALAKMEWLEAKKRKERTTKLMETITTAVANTVTLRLADALECYHNAAIGHVMNNRYADSLVMQQVCADVEGWNAVAYRLKEYVNDI